jgi:hypothetical protein
MECVAAKEHHPESEDVLRGSAGDEWACERRPTTDPGWVWCTDRHGTGAWVPEAFLAIEGGTARLVRDYISRELNLAPGDCVDLLDTESGWAWIRHPQLGLGWVPLDCLEPAAVK